MNTAQRLRNLRENLSLPKSSGSPSISDRELRQGLGSEVPHISNLGPALKKAKRKIGKMKLNPDCQGTSSWASLWSDCIDGY